MNFAMNIFLFLDLLVVFDINEYFLYFSIYE